MKKAKKNLSPAKKFRQRLRRAKFQKQQQAKDDYFEHDNREIAKLAKKRLSKKGRRAQQYIDAYLKSQHMTRNGDTASPDETQDSSNGCKSIVHGGRLPMTKEQAIQNVRLLASASSLAGNIPTVKCCCHCACSGAKRKTRRKLSSPYFGDFNRAMSFANGSCVRDAAAVTTKISTMTHHETLVKAAGGNYGTLAKAKPKHFGCGVREMRSVVRFVNES